VGVRGSARFRVVAGVTVSLLVLVLAQTALAATTLALSKASGPPTTKLNASGAGYGGGETVNLKFDAAPLATTTADGSGAFSVLVTIPASAAPGTHVITATGATTLVSAKKAFLVRTDWAQFHYNFGRSGYNPYENVLGTANVSTLGTHAWFAGPGGAGIFSSPVVSKGIVYIASSDGKLYAYKAATCAATSSVCAETWSTAADNFIYSSPASTSGHVLIGSDDDKLYVFPTSCKASPCAPSWIDFTGGGGSIRDAPAISGSVVFVGSTDGNLYAFPASCAPAGCEPLWKGVTGGAINASPAISGGIVYVTSGDGKLYAFPASCTPVQSVCQPMWTGSVGGDSRSTPSIANGTVYVGGRDGTNMLYAFPAGRCADPCNPIWTGARSSLSGNTPDYVIGSGPAVAKGRVYIGSTTGFLLAYKTTCSTSTCAPVWTGCPNATSCFDQPVESSPAVANGVIYVGTGDIVGIAPSYTQGRLVAFSAACSSSPCTPLWSSSTSLARRDSNLRPQSPTDGCTPERPPPGRPNSLPSASRRARPTRPFPMSRAGLEPAHDGL